MFSPLLATLALTSGACRVDLPPLPHRLLAAQDVATATAHAGRVLLDVTGAREHHPDGWIAQRELHADNATWRWTVSVHVPTPDAAHFIVSVEETLTPTNGEARTRALLDAPVHPEAFAVWCMAQEVSARLRPTMAAESDTVLVSLESLLAPARPALPLARLGGRRWHAALMHSTQGRAIGGAQLGWRPGALGLYIEGLTQAADAGHSLAYTGDGVSPLAAELTLGHASTGVSRRWTEVGGGVQWRLFGGPLVVTTGGGYAWDDARRVFLDPQQTINRRGAYTTSAYDHDRRNGVYGSVGGHLLLGRLTVGVRHGTRDRRQTVSVGWRW